MYHDRGTGQPRTPSSLECRQKLTCQPTVSPACNPRSQSTASVGLQWAVTAQPQPLIRVWRGGRGHPGLPSCSSPVSSATPHAMSCVILNLTTFTKNTHRRMCQSETQWKLNIEAVIFFAKTFLTYWIKLKWSGWGFNDQCEECYFKSIPIALNLDVISE